MAIIATKKYPLYFSTPFSETPISCDIPIVIFNLRSLFDQKAMLNDQHHCTPYNIKIN
jgi:hypothetical protein